MSIFQTQLLNELSAGHEGTEIPKSKRTYFQERFRGRVFDFLIGLFMREQFNGLTKAKLARRIGKSPEVINRWLGAPGNLTLDSVSDLLLGICAEELVLQAKPLLNQAPQIIHINSSENGSKTNPSFLKELNDSNGDKPTSAPAAIHMSDAA